MFCLKRCVLLDRSAVPAVRDAFISLAGISAAVRINSEVTAATLTLHQLLTPLAGGALIGAPYVKLAAVTLSPDPVFMNPPLPTDEE